MILRDSGSLVSLLLFVISAYNFIVGTCQVRAAPFVSRYIFQDGVHSLFCGAGRKTTYGYSQR